MAVVMPLPSLSPPHLRGALQESYLPPTHTCIFSAVKQLQVNLHQDWWMEKEGWLWR